MVASVELTHVAAPEFLHEASNDANFRWRDEQVHVIFHQDVGVQSATCVEQRFAQKCRIALPIVIVKKAGQSIVAALDNVLGNLRQVESRLSGHRVRIGGSMLPQ